MKKKELEADVQVIFAGNCVFTLLNEATGNRYTFKIVLDKNNPKRHKAYVLTGCDNNSDYTKIGNIYHKNVYYHCSEKITKEAVSVKVLKWFLDVLNKRKEKPDSVKIYHEGRCCKCGRRLTDPESIERGMGSECFEQIKGK